MISIICEIWSWFHLRYEIFVVFNAQIRIFHQFWHIWIKHQFLPMPLFKNKRLPKHDNLDRNVLIHCWINRMLVTEDARCILAEIFDIKLKSAISTYLYIILRIFLFPWQIIFNDEAYYSDDWGMIAIFRYEFKFEIAYKLCNIKFRFLNGLIWIYNIFNLRICVVNNVIITR